MTGIGMNFFAERDVDIERCKVYSVTARVLSSDMQTRKLNRIACRMNSCRMNTRGIHCMSTWMLSRHVQARNRMSSGMFWNEVDTRNSLSVTARMLRPEVCAWDIN